MGIVTLSGRLICADAAEAEAVRRHLPEHIRLTLLEPGCLAFSVEPTADPLVWRVEERFAHRDAFEAHQARTRASEWWAATRDIRREFLVGEA